MSEVYRVNGPRVISEQIDGELILVNMEKGTYYSTDGVGAALWRLVETGCTESDMIDTLHSAYGAGSDIITEAVTAFLARLREEDLVTLEEAPGRARGPVPHLSDLPGAFSSPILQSFSDMQDMLSLDPIHDVEAAGWPVPKMNDDRAASQQG